MYNRISPFIPKKLLFFYCRKLETNLKKTVDEIAQVETMIRNLKDAIWEKDAPNKVQLYLPFGFSPDKYCIIRKNMFCSKIFIF